MSTTINTLTFTYLNHLKANNNRPWFTDHKTEFIDLQDDFKQWIAQLEARLNVFDSIERAKMFRIYRDVRFSKDKTPYKTHFSSHITRLGQDKRGSYYVHVEPGNSFIAVGFYGPEKEDLLRIRKELEFNADPLKSILANDQLVNLFDSGLQGEELKTAPRGFDKSDPNIDLIRKKQYYLQHHFTDDEVMQEDFMDQVVTRFEAAQDFLGFFSEVLNTNLDGESII